MWVQRAWVHAGACRGAAAGAAPARPPLGDRHLALRPREVRQGSAGAREERHIARDRPHPAATPPTSPASGEVTTFYRLKISARTMMPRPPTSKIAPQPIRTAV